MSFELPEDGDDKRNNDGDFAPARRTPFTNETAEHNFLGGLTDATTAAFDPSSHRSWTKPSREEAMTMTQNQTPRHTISDLPKDVLKCIFVVVATRSYAARLSIPLVCKVFHSEVLECPGMWDTVEVMTGNDGALTSKSQVEYVAAEAGSRPLHVGLTIASSRTGEWRNESLPTWGNIGLGESAQSTQTLQILGLDMVGTIPLLMPRVEDFIFDVQDDPLEPELARAVLALFDDRVAGRLKGLTLLGDYQMGRIVRLTTPSNGAPSRLHPSLASLCHLAVAYCSAFTLPAPLDMIESLEISVVSVEPIPLSYPLVEFLLRFPNLQSLEIRTTIGTSAPEVYQQTKQNLQLYPLPV